MLISCNNHCSNTCRNFLIFSQSLSLIIKQSHFCIEKISIFLTFVYKRHVVFICGFGALVIFFIKYDQIRPIVIQHTKCFRMQNYQLCTKTQMYKLIHHALREYDLFMGALLGHSVQLFPMTYCRIRPYTEPRLNADARRDQSRDYTVSQKKFPPCNCL